MAMDGETTKMIAILSLVRHLLMSAVVWIPMAMGIQTTVIHFLQSGLMMTMTEIMLCIAEMRISLQ